MVLANLHNGEEFCNIDSFEEIAVLYSQTSNIDKDDQESGDVSAQESVEVIADGDKFLIICHLKLNDFLCQAGCALHNNGCPK